MCFAFFAIAPLFYIGGSDLGNRSTIPLLVILYIVVIKFLDKLNKKDKRNWTKQKILIAILVISAVTNYNEIYRALKVTYIDYKDGYSNFADGYKTFDTFEDKECASFITNFVVKNDKDNKVLQFLIR